MKKIRDFFRWYFKAQSEFYLRAMEAGVNPFM